MKIKLEIEDYELNKIINVLSKVDPYQIMFKEFMENLKIQIQNQEKTDVK